MKLIKYFNIASKLLLTGLFAHYLLNQDLPQYQNKGMAGRLIVYPLIVSIVFIVYWVVRWRMAKKIAHPHLIDLLVTLPFAVDLLGNSLNLFNTIEWWDDLMHLLLWGFWVLAVGVALRSYTKLSRLPVIGLTIGFGAVSSILWEIAEYLAFVPNSPMESPTAYRDTMGDEVLSLFGSIIGGLLISTVLWQVAKKAKKA